MPLKFYALPALQAKLVELNDGQTHGFVANTRNLLESTRYGKKPNRSYLSRVISSNQGASQKLALNLVRIAEGSLGLSYSDAMRRSDKWFDVEASSVGTATKRGDSNV